MFSSRKLILFSRNWARCSSTQTASTTLAHKFVSDFKVFYPKLVNSTLAKIDYLDHVYARDQIKKISEYYPMAKYPVQGEFMLYIYEMLEKSKNINENVKHQAYTLGCVLEAIQANYTIQDDVLDNAKIRSSKPCWHLQPYASNLGLNDNNMLRSFINEIMRQNIEESKYAQIMDVCLEMFINLEMAQELDLRLQNSKDCSKYTMHNYNLLQTYKTSYYILVAPLKMALILSNKASEESFQLVEDLCCDFGVTIQIHNDVVDTNEWMEKTTSTDIQFGKCTWPAIAVLERGNPEQRKIFEENYGIFDPKCVNRIKKLYYDVNWLKLYEDEIRFRRDTYLQKVNNLPKDAVPSSKVFHGILEFFRGYVDDTSNNVYN